MEIQVSANYDEEKFNLNDFVAIIHPEYAHIGKCQIKGFNLVSGEVLLVPMRPCKCSGAMFWSRSKWLDKISNVTADEMIFNLETLSKEW